ncbi:TolC family protein [Arcobacter roscoffensis]|uniref:TolC family protein n=1 Tax=Arcobacter roscoffensis TaxID=2961520 RepID=A0ABY5E2J1_9BACT|nr:TolC family protein [Arcobacter roscoffensis]UTJ05784.1 TolC family protein [Arcobacter roscoffensis]
MKNNRFIYGIPVLMVLFSVGEATSLKDVVSHTLKSNQDIYSKSLNNNAFKNYIDEEKTAYYPKVDLTASLEKIKEKEKSPTLNTNETRTGNNIRLDLEQLLYDGGLSSSKIESAKYTYMSNKYKNSDDIENIILDGIISYLNMVKSQERINISEDNIKVHNNYLQIARETEDINGTILDKVQTKAKIHNAKNKLFDEINNYNLAKSSFDKNVGMKVLGEICRPSIDESKVPSSLKDLKTIALSSNYKIKEQIENIKEQREKLAQTDSNFLPTLKFKLQAIHDDELITDETETKRYTGKIELTYNIFNGLSDEKASQRERLFLKESKAKLDVVTKDIIDQLTSSFNTYQTSKSQIIELKQFIEENKQIIEIYKDQFDSGTRSFIDVLNVEADLYNSKISLINTQFNMYQSYYKILKLMSTLQNTISDSQRQVCDADDFFKEEPKKDELKDMEEELNLEESSTLETQISTPKTSVENEYALFLNTYSTMKKAQDVLDNTKTDLKNNQKLKVILNSKASYTLAAYNIKGKQNAVSLKESLDYKFPNSYFIKKSK